MSANSQANAEAPFSRYRAQAFAERWRDATSEKQDAQSFWREFFTDVCGVADIREAGIEFEKAVVSSTKGSTNYIDVFWSGVALIEHKSAGKDLDQAERQAREYIVSLPPASRPPALVVSDFQRLRIVEYLLNESYEFPLAELAENVDRIADVLSGDTRRAIAQQVTADQKASQLMGDLFLELEKNGYQGHEASVFLVRMLFCLFADDTGMWKKQIFQDFLLATMEDGSGVGARIQTLFEILNTPRDRRPKVIDEQLVAFPYVNGDLFAEPLPTFFFTREMRAALINASRYDWSSINPTIFGSLFQAIKSKEDRRSLGEHYTTEDAINKVLDPIVFDELNKEVFDAWDSNTKLRKIKNSLSEYRFLDPACGSGNFLITAYKRLRELELEIIVRIKQLEGTTGQVGLLDGTIDLSVSLEQFFGIEIEEWSSQIATVALFLTDHQKNMELETVLGYAPDRFPLSRTSNIVHGNALTMSWESVCSMDDKTLIVSNPPFLGYSNQTAEQKSDQLEVWKGVKGAGILDYVSNWYLIASRALAGTSGRFAFVSTNSIAQGSQPPILWAPIFANGFEIQFAHRTFVWNSDVQGKASVHCVIVGLANKLSKKKKVIFDYKDGKGTPIRRNVSTINGYLLDAPNVLVSSRSTPLQSFVQKMDFGSKPTDGGFLSDIDVEVAKEIYESDEIAGRYLRRLIGSQELINGKDRFCLWLVDALPQDIRNSPVLKERVAQVRAMRESSTKGKTRKDAEIPWLFQEIRQPSTPYLAVPAVSSGSREYVPMALMPPEVIVNNALLTIPGSDLRTFAILHSATFNLWNETVSGRLKSDFRISAEITYNNFPFPEMGEDDASLSETGRRIIEARDEYPESSLADLYNPTTMPKSLRSAHKLNDEAVLRVYGLSKRADREEVLRFLFERYASLSRESTLI